MSNKNETSESKYEDKRKNGFLKIFKNTVSSLITAAAVAVLISYMLFPVFRITGKSMTPTFENNELLVCRKNAKIENGDVIAFYYNNKILLKRVIAQSGDVIDIDKNGIVYINEEVINEPYISDKSLGECDIEFPYEIPEDRYSVMGDNRKLSIDSRTSLIGCVSSEAIVGKAIAVIYPFNKLKIIK